MTSEWQLTLQGAYATPDLVGRQEILTQVMGQIQAIESTKPCLIFLRGPGGIGKTRLLTEIINRCKPIPEIEASDYPVDAYHLLYHTSYEMTQAIYNSLRPTPEPFRLYERAAKTLERLKLAGDALKIEEQQNKALRAFVDDLQHFSQSQRVVITIDTIERFVYGVEQLAGIPEAAEAWDWLVKEMTNLSNVVVVAAGRQSADSLLRNIPPSIAVLVLDVGALDLKESIAYFDAAAQMARENRATEVAVRLDALSSGEKEQAYHLSGGRPILLALVADYLSSAGSLAPLFAEASSGTNESLQSRFEDKILVRLLNLPGLGQVLRGMALMSKGVDAELLSRTLNIMLPEAKDYLRQVEKLSFVKVHRVYDLKKGKDTYFLHDEMYALLQTRAFSGLHGQREKQEIIQRAIECYEVRFIGVRRQLANLYAAIQLGGRGEINDEMLKDLIAQRIDILLALLYYRLQVDSEKGYRRWFRYDHEATVANELVLSHQLQIEYMAYLREQKNDRAADMPADYEALVIWSLMISSVKRAWANQDNQKVLAEADKLVQRYPDQISDPVKKAMLMVWKAYALIASDLPAAQVELKRIITEMEVYVNNSVDPTLHWLGQTLLAFAYRVHAYADRVQGAIGSAIEYYRRAAIILREVDLKIEMATVHNDLGYALVLQGAWADARSLVENGLDMRRDLGLGIQVAYSLNTLAMIEVYEANFPEAIDYATYALNIFRMMEHNRGEGMALTALAEAIRRRSGILTGAEPKDRVNMLGNAFEMADEALIIFETLKEKPRQVEALIEKGCARRDAVRLLKDFDLPMFSKDKWIKESLQALDRAADLAGEAGILYRQVDALVNKAWLGYFADGENGEAIQKQARDDVMLLLKGYELLPGKSKPLIWGQPGYEPLLSSQLGKLHVLSGHQTYNNNPEAWKARIIDLKHAPKQLRLLYHFLAREYFLGLENSSLYSTEYRDLHQTKQQIFDNLKVFRSRNLELFVEFLDECEKQHGLSRLDGSQLRKMLVNRALIAE